MNTDVIVTCHKDIAQKINVYLNTIYDVFNEIKVEVVAINDYVGTADALRYLKEKDKLKVIINYLFVFKIFNKITGYKALLIISKI